MASPPKHLVSGPTRKCIFCGGGGTRGNRMSGEHLWSDWMKGLFPATLEQEYFEVANTFAGKSMLPRRSQFYRERQGAPHRLKVKVVCSNCNSGWMSGIEERAKPHLSSLIQGTRATITPSSCEDIAVWIALKTLVAENIGYHDYPAMPIFSQLVRDEFKAQRKVPRHFRIWLGHQSGNGKWATGFFRQAAPFSTVEFVPKKTAPSANVQSATFGIGRAIFHIFATTDNKIANLMAFNIPLFQIWPRTGAAFNWPGQFVVHDGIADMLAASLTDFLKSPAVRDAIPLL